MTSTTGTATTNAQEFIESSSIFLKDDFLPKLLYCLHDMSEEDIWWRPNERSNSVGNLILHLCGNLRQWILHSIGGIPFDRNRDAEFDERRPKPKQELIAGLEETIKEVDRVLTSLPPDSLLDRFSVQSWSTTRLQAVYHVVEHFSYHLGQILYIYKLRTGRDPGFYRHLAKKQTQSTE
jgi:uncharacterized damage-inducible protein DinB